MKLQELWRTVAQIAILVAVVTNMFRSVQARDAGAIDSATLSAVYALICMMFLIVLRSPDREAKDG